VFDKTDVDGKWIYIRTRFEAFPVVLEWYSAFPVNIGRCLDRGNVDGIIQGGAPINVADLTYLVDYLFRGGPPTPRYEEGNVDGNNGTNIADLTYLVDYLFRGGPPPPTCPLK
jgi:hypothetical protein